MNYELSNQVKSKTFLDHFTMLSDGMLMGVFSFPKITFFAETYFTGDAFEVSNQACKSFLAVVADEFWENKNNWMVGEKPWSSGKGNRS
jgi:hypothetical protein